MIYHFFKTQLAHHHYLDRRATNTQWREVCLFLFQRSCLNDIYKEKKIDIDRYLIHKYTTLVSLCWTSELNILILCRK